MRIKRNKFPTGQVLLNIFFILLCICYAYPLLLLLTISVEGASGNGFSIIVKDFTLQAYQQIFSRPEKIIRAYGVTFFYSIVATLGSLLVMSMFAYALSKRDFRYRNVITFLLFFTTLFSGGIVPSYLVNAKFLHLNDTIWIYIFPALMNAWNNQALTEEQEQYLLHDLNEGDSTVTTLSGFIFNKDDVQTKIEQCTAVSDEYRDTLGGGIKGDDWEAYYEEYIGKMELAGVRDVIDAYNSQLNAYLGR